MTFLAASTRSFFAGLSRARGRRIFHPHGVGFEATLEPLAPGATGAELFDERDPRPAIVRLSRSLGLPEAFPDPCGIGLRVPDAYGSGLHQDLLLVSSARAVAGRHLVLPARGFADRPYSSLLPYRLAGRRVVFGAVVLAAGRGPKLSELRRLERSELRIRIMAAAVAGKWTPVAELALGARLDPGETEGLRLDPTNTGGGLELAGALNRLRGPAYRGSQEGRGAPHESEGARTARAA